jgi:hypothetical protein
MGKFQGKRYPESGYLKTVPLPKRVIMLIKVAITIEAITIDI